jgi:hypothetical protein
VYSSAEPFSPLSYPHLAPGDIPKVHTRYTCNKCAIKGRRKSESPLSLPDSHNVIAPISHNLPIVYSILPYIRVRVLCAQSRGMAYRLQPSRALAWLACQWDSESGPRVPILGPRMALGATLVLGGSPTPYLTPANRSWGKCAGFLILGRLLPCYRPYGRDKYHKRADFYFY